jgi:hypothetical protein
MPFEKAVELIKEKQKADEHTAALETLNAQLKQLDELDV